MKREQLGPQIKTKANLPFCQQKVTKVEFIRSPDDEFDTL